MNDFIGEFLFHPAPIEVSGNTCSHNCNYCFANIRKNERVVDLKKFIRFCNKTDPVSYIDNLIAEEYPICISNKTDPFSTSNYIHTIAMCQQLTKLKNGIFFQTKTGKGLWECEKILDRKNIIWYITITTIREEIRKRIEPGAPSTDERLKTAQELKKKGYHVIIALNPLLEEWMPKADLYKLLGILNNIGLNYICLEALHLNRKEVDNFTPARLKSFNPSEIEYATSKGFQNYVKEVIPLLIKENFHVVKLGMPYPTKFYEPIKKWFGHIFPNQYDIINHCYNTKLIGNVTFDLFYELSVDNKPFFERHFNRANSYIIKQSMRAWADSKEAKKIDTLKEVLRFMWNTKIMKGSLQNNQTFRTLIKGGKTLKDEENNLILYFDGGVYPNDRSINI
jgi:DNA repair photolyase